MFHRGAVQALASGRAAVTPRLASLVRTRADPPRPRPVPGRGRLPLSPPADPRRRLRRPAEGGPGRAARALRRLARGARRRPRRARRDRRLPPRAGGSLPSTSSDRPIRALAERAGDRLAGAGRRALWRGDEPRGGSLLERALALTRPHRLDVVLELDLAEACRRADVRRPPVAEAAAERARGGRRPWRGDRTCRRRQARHRDDPATIEELGRPRARHCPCSSEEDDHAASPCLASADQGGGHAWPLRGERAMRLSGRFAARPRLRPTALRTVHGLPDALVMGPRPADEAL